MKKIYFSLLFAVLCLGMKATSYTVAISGTSYVPATLTVTVGDVVTIQADGTHTLAEVSQATWSANGTSTLSTGFGEKTSNYTFTVSSTNTIYYVCKAHVTSGMKGMIIISPAGINEQEMNVSNVIIFPNPAKDKFSVKFNSPENGNVSAKLYSICGQEIESLIINKEFNAGVFTIHFDSHKRIPAGVYFVQLNCNSNKITRKLIID